MIGIVDTSSVVFCYIENDAIMAEIVRSITERLQRRALRDTLGGNFSDEYDIYE